MPSSQLKLQGNCAALTSRTSAGQQGGLSASAHSMPQCSTRQLVHARKGLLRYIKEKLLLFQHIELGQPAPVLTYLCS